MMETLENQIVLMDDWYLVRDYFRVKHVELIDHWHPEKAISCNAASSETQNFLLWETLF